MADPNGCETQAPGDYQNQKTSLGMYGYAEEAMAKDAAVARRFNEQEAVRQKLKAVAMGSLSNDPMRIHTTQNTHQLAFRVAQALGDIRSMREIALLLNDAGLSRLRETFLSNDPELLNVTKQLINELNTEFLTLRHILQIKG